MSGRSWAEHSRRPLSMGLLCPPTITTAMRDHSFELNKRTAVFCALSLLLSQNGNEHGFLRACTAEHHC